MRPKILEGEKVTVIIPAWNEEGFIGRVLRSLIKWREEDPNLREVLVVDDGSTDKTAEISREIGVKVIPSGPEKRERLGKGQAFLAGAKYAKDKNSTILVSLDADILDFTPKKLTGLIAELKTKKLNMLIAIQLEHKSPIKHVSGFVFPKFSPFPVFQVTPQKELSGLRAFRITALEPLLRKKGKWLEMIKGFGLEVAMNKLIPRQSFSKITFETASAFRKSPAQQVREIIRSEKLSSERAALANKIKEIKKGDKMKAKKLLVRAKRRFSHIR